MDEEKSRITKKSAALQKARTRSQNNNGASPILNRPDPNTKGNDKISPEGTAGAENSSKAASGGRKRKNCESLAPGEEAKRSRMDEELKKFMSDVRIRLSELPTKDQFHDYNARIGRNEGGIEENRTRIDEQEKKIDSIKASVERLEQEQIRTTRGLPARIESMMGESGGNGRRTKEEVEYTRARRSMRLWPIEGETAEEIQSNTRLFLTDALEMEQSEVKNIKTHRPKNESNTNYQGPVFNEVVVEFDSNNTRDKVSTRGIKLKDFVDNDRKPTCGLRMEVPEHMLPTFRILHRYGLSLRRRMGNDFKKHIKFDDYRKSLFLQARTDPDSEWMNITPDEADESMRKGNARRSERLRTMLTPGERNDTNEVTTRRRASISAMEECYHTQNQTTDGKKKWKPMARRV